MHSLADRVDHVNDSHGLHSMPLMWSASVGDDTCPVLQWLAGAAQHIESMIVGSTTLSGHDTVVVGWEALSEVMRSWDIRSREDLAEWIFRQGFPRPRWGAHITARAQERILTMAVPFDARVGWKQFTWRWLCWLAGAFPCHWNRSFHEAVCGGSTTNSIPRDVP